MTLPRLGAVGEILARPVPVGWHERDRANQRCVPRTLCSSCDHLHPM